MSERLFETFLAKHFLAWADRSVEPGFRYQFQSPNLDNSLKLFRALVSPELVSGTIVSGDTTLAYIKCSQVKLITVVQDDSEGPGYTENFISFLRDKVASQHGEFKSSALLIIHNSLLDTIINSAEDLSGQGAVFDPLEIKTALLELVDKSSQPDIQEVSKILLEYQFDLIAEDEGSMFGFAPLYSAIADGQIEFSELGLLPDPEIKQMQGQNAPAQIRSRLDSNRELYQAIEDVLEHYPDQLQGNLPDLSTAFIEKNFSSEHPDDWKAVSYSEFRKEQARNQDQTLEVNNESSATAELVVRTLGNTRSAQKSRHLLLVVDEDRDDFDLSLDFKGGRIRESEVKLVNGNQDEVDDADYKVSGGSVNASIMITGVVSESPRFFRLELKREKTSENYRFHCLVVKKGQFNVDPLRNVFCIDVKKNMVKLQTQETEIRISTAPTDNRCVANEVGQSFDVTQHDIVDFTDLANEVDRIEFSVKSADALLRFDVEGAAAKDALTLPLLFDRTKTSQLFTNELFGIYNRTKERVYVNNQELKSSARMTQLLKYEAELVEQSIVFNGPAPEGCLTIADIEREAPEMAQSYDKLYGYYKSKNTLPSLCGWGEEYLALVAEVVAAYQTYLASIPQKQYLEDTHKRILKVGFGFFEDSEYILPVHPLTLAYYHSLSIAALNEESGSDARSFFKLPDVTLQRLNPQGLIPFIFDSQHQFSYVKTNEENCFWLDCVPHQETNYSYVTKLVKDKIGEFLVAFAPLFDARETNARSTLIINSVNNYDNHELFMGVVAHVTKHKLKVTNIHVNIYDDVFMHTEFDLFSDLASYDRIKEQYGLNMGDAKSVADTIVDLLRTRVTYSKFVHSEVNEQAYAHLSFFRNSEKVKVINVNPDEKLSGISCHGLINGEASANEQNNYITGFGMRNVDHANLPHLEIAKLLGRLIHPSRESTVEYRENSAIALAVDDKFRALLERSYDSSIWTSVIDPKVTLDFFDNSKNMLLIHYSDQYTSSASYDAITVTRQTDLYDRVLEKEHGGSIGEFNAFNGEWLLQMITASSNTRKERTGILAAYKLVSCLLAESDITWVPMSAAEMVRVSGNIGLNMSESELSRRVQGYSAGAISDDVLFVGIKGENLFLLPLEVKAGNSYSATKAVQQAQELGRYLVEDVLNGDALERKIYRSLFVRQLLMQVDKYLLYSIYPDGYFDPLLKSQEWWLQGDYEVFALKDYPRGFVVACLESESCLETSATLVGDILKIEIPNSFVPMTIKASLKELMRDSSPALTSLPEKCFLKDSVAEKYETKIVDDGIALPYEPEIELAIPEPVAEPLAQEIPKASSETVSPTAPINGGDTLKILVGHEVNHGEPVYWEPTNTAKYMNTNSGIIGTMGTGKTQCTKSIVTQLVRKQHLNVDGHPIGMLIFDYKSDYVDDAFLTATSAEKYKLHKLPYNPLSLFGDTPMLPVHTGRGFSETMGKAFGLGQKQQLRLRKLIGDAYELAGISKANQSTWTRPAPTIADVWALFLDQEKIEEDSLYAALESLSELEIFEDDVAKCTSLYELVDGITVIELAGYPPQIQNLVVALTMDLFYSQMQKQGKPKVDGDFRQVTKMILVDEADNFMSQDFPSLRKVLKEGREYGVGVILSTQDITHFKTKENDYSAYILSWVVHRVSQIKNQDIKSLFNKDDKGDQDHLMKAIRELEKHFSLYVDGDMRIRKIKDRAFWELLNDDY